MHSIPSIPLKFSRKILILIWFITNVANILLHIKNRCFGFKHFNLNLKRQKKKKKITKLIVLETIRETRLQLKGKKRAKINKIHSNLSYWKWQLCFKCTLNRLVKCLSSPSSAIKTQKALTLEMVIDSIAAVTDLCRKYI